MIEFSLASENYGFGCFSSVHLSLKIYRFVRALLLRSSKVVVLFTVVAAESPPTGEDDGLRGFCKNDES